MAQGDSQIIPSSGNDLESDGAVGRSTNGIFAKLQLVLPLFSSPKRIQTLPTPSTSEPAVYPKQKLKFIKVRIITWNMHDALPNGNLDYLLGSVPTFVERKFENDDERFHLPNLSLDDMHPYHIVVVGGQECPTLSGIPMGLAANFKHREPGGHHENAKAKNKQERSERHTFAGADPLLPHSKNERRHTVHHVDGAVSPQLTPGWTALLEDWFSNGVGSLTDVKPAITSDPVTESASLTSEATPPVLPFSDFSDGPSLINVSWEATDPRDSREGTNKSAAGASPHQGPYQLLVKDRLMGIYTAVFVHRDIFPLIKGVSTDTVPAGFIGGRLGNKGGVGISMDLNGTRLLFINAHLAAHDGNVALRVANLDKIKAELTVEPFLPSNDSRLLKEDPTEKFDYSWIFGDLNFRLDITRLHADWLIAKKEFNKAFAFDELSDLLKREDAIFKGFQEAKIDFPPTFKYDVPHRRHRFHRKRVQDMDVVKEDSVFPSDVTGSTSSMSSEISALDIRRRPNPRLKYPVLSRIASTTKRVSSKLWDRVRFKDTNICRKTNLGTTSAVTSKVPKQRIETKHHMQIQHHVENQSNNSPVYKGPGPSTCKVNGYDSSSKQRVPAWCDRILWKTTVQLEEHKLPDNTNIYSSNFGKTRRAYKTYTADNYTPDQVAMPKTSSKYMVSGPRSRATSFDLQTKPLRMQSVSTDPELTPNPIRRRSMSTCEELDQSIDVLDPRKVERSSPRTLPKRWLPQFLTSREFGLTSRSNSIKLNRSDIRIRRGEIVCLSYHTLDDEQMAKLEGWSDHRPVIGSYAIHL